MSILPRMRPVWCKHSLSAVYNALGQTEVQGIGRSTYMVSCMKSISSSAQQGDPMAATPLSVTPPAAEAQMPMNPVQMDFPRGSRRCGVIAVKVGMTQEWDEWGQRIPLTVLWIDHCQVVQVKREDKEGYFSLQLGIGAKRDKQLISSQRGHFKWAGVNNKRKLAEFRVTPDALLPQRTEITAAHFTPGQYVDVQGTTIGKGFSGVMKKWGFAGQPASHGNTKKHRAPGSIGACQDPGKVWPGKKMAGRMGGETRTVLSAHVFKVDHERNLIYVKGQVPGHKGNFVLVKDAVMKTYAEQPQRPFPTFLNGLSPVPLYAPKAPHNPFERRER